jgi:hypothetical protein
MSRPELLRSSLVRILLGLSLEEHIRLMDLALLPQANNLQKEQMPRVNWLVSIESAQTPQTEMRTQLP